MTSSTAVSPSQWLAAGEQIQVNGRRVFVAVHGSGSPLLVLHAFPTSSYDFAKVVAPLAARQRVVLFDYPGFGGSEKPRHHPFSLFEAADTAEGVCQVLGLERVAILAHDIGDSVALELIRRQRLGVERLCLLNGAVWSIPFADRRLALAQRLSLHVVSGPLLSRLGVFRYATFRSFMNRVFGSPPSADDLAAFWSLIERESGPASYHHLLRYMPERWRHQESWLQVLAAHPAPLTLVWGLRDPVATPMVAEVVRQLRPDVTWVPLVEVGHYPQWEAPDAVVRALERASA